MRIKQNVNPLTEEKTYEIDISLTCDLNPQEIAECFKSQYPKDVCLIKSARVTAIEISLIIVGLDIERRKK